MKKIHIYFKGNHIPVNDWTLGWHESLKHCITKHATYFMSDFRNSCSLIRAPSWTNFFRQQASFYYDFRSQKG